MIVKVKYRATGAGGTTIELGAGGGVVTGAGGGVADGAGTLFTNPPDPFAGVQPVHVRPLRQLLPLVQQ